MSEDAPPSAPPIVLDTNVVVSAVLAVSPSSPPVRVLRAVRNGLFRMVLSDALFAEYRDALYRPHLVRRHQLSAEELEVILWALSETARWVQVVADVETPPDANDVHVWATCIASPEAMLITGDADLLAFARGRATALTPREFVTAHLPPS
ncbi:MAG: putative toxin-antitoxin system toxin component, PIN family [Dehalococcoidia bacterium]